MFKVILFLANKIGGTNGNVIANLDIITSILLNGYKVATVTFDDFEMPTIIGDRDVPSLDFTITFPSWPPTQDKINTICNLLAHKNIELVISNECAFHNLFHKRILPSIDPEGKCKTVLISHTQPTNYTFGVDISTMIRRFQEYDFLIGVSCTALNNWREKGLTHSDDRCFYAPNCCSEEKALNILELDREAVRMELGVDSSTYMVVCIASIQKRKNQELLIEQMGEFLQVKPNMKLYLVGPYIGNEDGEDIVANAERSPYADNIIIVGEVLDAMRYTYAADLFILPSLGEALPLSILEAMVLNTPIIASDVGGIPEMIEDGVDGFTFDLNDTSKMLSAFSLLSTNSTRCSDIVENANKKYWSTFSRSRHIECWGHIVESILSS